MALLLALVTNIITLLQIFFVFVCSTLAFTLICKDIQLNLINYYLVLFALLS